jgi:hypothetical protein
MLNDIYLNYWSDYFNFFISSSKLISKERIGAKTVKMHDKPQTPLQRIMGNKDIPNRIKKRLQILFKQSNPFELQSIIHGKIIEILNLLEK